MLSIAFGQSKYYVDSLSENTKRGLRQKVRRGECPGQAPLGYVNDRLNKKILLDPKVAPILKELFALYAKGNSTFESLSNVLHSKGILSRGGKPIHNSRVTFILSNPFYFGYFRFNKEIYQGIHEPLITKKLYDEVQAVIKRRTHVFPLKSLDFPFTGLLRCGECGMMITAEHHFRRYETVGHSQDFIYYRCTKKKRFASCSQPFIRQEILTAQLNHHIQQVSLSASDHEWLIKRMSKDELIQRSDTGGHVQGLKQGLLNISGKLNILLDSYLDNVVSREDYLTKKNQLMGQKKTIEEKISTLEHVPNKWLEPMRTFFDTALTADKIAGDNENLYEKKEFLRKTGSNLTLKNRIVDCDLPEQWAALRAAPTTRNLEARAGIGPAQ